MAMPASEEARQPAIRGRRLQRRIGTTFVLRGYVFIGLHEDSVRMAI
jgi:hypothetical protein